MLETTSQSPGTRLASQLRDSLRAFRIGPVGGGRNRPIIWGVTDKGTCVGGMTVDGFLDRAAETLLDSDRLYLFGNSVVYERPGPHDARLTTLAVEDRPEPNAASILANLFAVGVEGEKSATQSLAPSKLINAVLADEALRARLPEIRHYSRRPCFDPDFNLCRPGWNPASGILVHGADVVPAMEPPAFAPDAGAADRLPPHLRALLGEFDWRADADQVNAVALFLTGLLANHFVDDPHPVGVIDANQPGIGKTLYVQVLGRVLDGAEPPRIPLTHDEELEKKLCAQLRSSRTSLFFIDNVRARIESMILEQNVLSPLVSFRILGRSVTIERPNIYLWLITSNLTAGTPDFLTRGLPIRLFYEGDPARRAFRGSPLEYAGRHRQEILAELAGMVLRWVAQGKRPGVHEHRCNRWAAVIGGILDANGLGRFFLANVAEAAAQMDQGLLDLATLAEHVVGKDLADLYGPAGGAADGKGKPATRWAAVAGEARVLGDKLADANPKGRATVVGTFLAGKVDREVPIETAAGTRTATLRRRQAGGGQKSYYFEVATPAADVGEAGRSPAPAHAGDPVAQGPAAPDGGPVTDVPPPRTDAAPNITDHPPAAGVLEWVGV